jgi:hypothetical protein
MTAAPTPTVLAQGGRTPAALAAVVWRRSRPAAAARDPAGVSTTKAEATACPPTRPKSSATPPWCCTASIPSPKRLLKSGHSRVAVRSSTSPSTRTTNCTERTFSSLYTIDKNSAVCTLISHGQYSNSLSFVPKGTADPLVEALVGYAGNKYIRIDPVTGDTTTIGALGGGYASSGDIVSVKNGGTYLTVVGNGCQDCLAEVDPVTGALIKNLGPLYHVGVYGLAYWGGSAYGFSSSGKLFEIHFAPNSVTTTLIPIPNAPSSLQFWGAGSSTHVPLVRPK